MIKVKDLKQRKYTIMVEAAMRWKAETKPSGTSARDMESLRKTTTDSSRINNYALREARRAILPSKPARELDFFEKKIGNTYDTNKFPPSDIAYKAGRPVAMLHEFIENRMPAGFGTGFLISNDLLITNHHVFPNEADAENCAATFFYEYDVQGLKPGVTFRLLPAKFFLSNSALDYAVIAVEQLSVDTQLRLADIGCIRLIETIGKIVIGDPVNIIQHPMGRPKEYAYTENKVKQIDDTSGLIHYTTDTLSASSGSPAFNKNYEVAALHHRGVPYMIGDDIYTVDGKIWDGEDEDEVQWVANEGISVSKIVADLKKQNMNDPIKGQLLRSLLTNTIDPLFSPAVSSAIATVNESLPATNPQSVSKSQTSLPMHQFLFNFYGNTTINIAAEKSNGASDVSPLSINGKNELTALEKAIRFDENYNNRKTKGYKEKFITGFVVPPPAVVATRMNEMLMKNGQVLILKYYHYSIVMNESRRMVMWSAVNVDYSKKGTLTRAQLGTDSWRSDPRIPGEVQIVRKEVYDPARNIDLGHIVRREDSCWGDDDQTVEFANSDTFHYTNCTPQHEAFNRANPPKSEGYDGIHGVWGQLEDEIKRQLNLTESKASIFAGPILNETDPTKDFGLGEIQYPLKFWKVVVVADEDDGLLAYGFVLDQTKVVTDFGLGFADEKLLFKNFKKEQMPIKEITKLSGVEFDDIILNADVLKNNFNEAGKPGIAYDMVENIQVRPKKVPQGNLN